MLRGPLATPGEDLVVSWFKELIGTPDRDGFAQMFIEALRRGGESEAIEYDPAEFRLTVGDSEKSYFNLTNLYHEFRHATWFRRRGLLGRYSRLRTDRAASAVPTTFREAQRCLLPRVRELSFYGTTRLYAQISELGPFGFAYRPLTEHLAVELVYDQPDSMAMISAETMDGWGVGFDLALDVALQNLVEATPGMAARFDRPVTGLYVSSWKDNHDASRLVLLDLIRSLDVVGDPVAMVPNRDHLIVTGTDNPVGLEKMAELTEAASSEPRFMSGVPVKLEWDRWAPWIPERDHPLFSRFEMLRVRTLGRDYMEQKELLERLLHNLGDDTCVASYSATRQESGEMVSHCVWPEGVRTLLPRTDRVLFFSPKESEDQQIVAVADWERVIEVVGELMVPRDEIPERYLVRAFPSAVQLEAIRMGEVA